VSSEQDQRIQFFHQTKDARKVFATENCMDSVGAAFQLIVGNISFAITSKFYLTILFNVEWTCIRTNPIKSTISYTAFKPEFSANFAVGDVLSAVPF
jgi:hypothetical protein